MSIYQKWAAGFCLLTAVAMMLGQILKEIVYYAPLLGWFSGLVFSIVALFMAVKANKHRADT